MTAPLLRAATLVALLAAGAPARAQIVNVQPILATKSQDGFSLALEGSLDWKAGNVDLLLTSFSGVARFQRGRHLLFAMARGDFGFRLREAIISRDTEHLRYRVNAWRFVDWEVFAQHSRDQFRRLSVRALGGTGPRVRVFATRLVEVAVSAAYMLEFERLSTGDFSDSGLDTLLHRLSFFGMITVALGEKVRLGHTVFFQPALTDRRDLRVFSETELLVALSKLTSIKLGASFILDTQPPVQVEPLDSSLRTALQLSF